MAPDARPEAPTGSYEATDYGVDDIVFFFRHGKSHPYNTRLVGDLRPVRQANGGLDRSESKMVAVRRAHDIW